MNSVGRSKPFVILMADDDEDDRSNAKDALLESKVLNEFRSVADGEELMDYLRGRGPFAGAPKPGLIFLDLNMPKKNGREALREIKSDPELRHIPVVVMTTSHQPEDIAATYDLGANSFITKPADFASLVRIMSQVGQYWFDIVTLPHSNR